MHDDLKSLRVLSSYWLRISFPSVAPIRVRSLLLVLKLADLSPVMSIGGTIATSVIFFDLPGNLSLPCTMSRASSIRFCLAELPVFVGGSKSNFVFSIFLNFTLPPFHLDAVDFIKHHLRSHFSCPSPDSWTGISLPRCSVSASS